MKLTLQETFEQCDIDNVRERSCFDAGRKYEREKLSGIICELVADLEGIFAHTDMDLEIAKLVTRAKKAIKR